jgi:hypothetical protein
VNYKYGVGSNNTEVLFLSYVDISVAEAQVVMIVATEVITREQGCNNYKISF